MTFPATPPSVSAGSARQRVARAEAIKEAWRLGEPPDAAAVLREEPDIAADRAVALDLAYEEFCVREEDGEALDSSAFCARFSFGASLRRLIGVHRFLDDHPDALGGPPANWPGVGESVGDFLVVRELGRGGFSRVYLAVETTAGGRPVALKVSAAGSREADTLGPLSHPHLIPVLSSRAAGAWTVVAMPFGGTATLEDVLSVAWDAGRRGPRSAGVLLEAAARGGRAEDPPFPSSPAFPVRAATSYEDGVAAVAAGLLAAIAYLHDRGVSHPDLKPSNVLLAPTGHPYLLDFNLATRVSDPGRLAGTIPYMAPEQLTLLADEDAVPPADWRLADVFACGVILFELLTGRHPFGDPAARAAGRDRAEVAADLLASQRAGHPSLASLNPRVRRVVRAAVERCLSVEPCARPTAAELADLFACTGARRSWRRFTWPILGGAALAALALSAAHWWPVPQPASAEPAAPADPFERGLLLYRQGQHALAANEFLAAGRARPDGRAYACAAYCLSVIREYKLAAGAADEAIRLGYRTAAVYANRAYNHLQCAHLSEAKNDCDEALRLDPELRAARFTRAAVYLQIHHLKGVPVPPEAVADIDRVTAGAPNTPDVWMAAAQIYALSPGDGLRDRAARAVREAVLAGKPPAAVGRNPALQRTLGDHPVFKEALTLEPGRPEPSAEPHLSCPIP